MQHRIRITAAQVAESLGIAVQHECVRFDPVKPWRLKQIEACDHPEDYADEVITIGGERYVRVPNVITQTIQRGKRARVGQYSVFETRHAGPGKPQTAVIDVRCDVLERINYEIAKAERAARGWKAGRGALA